MIETNAPNEPITAIPRGVADYFWHEAAARRQAEANLLETFRRWGYTDVMPPSFEYADVLAARANDELQAELVRFLDRDGSTLALRPDMTIAVARLVGTRLHDWPMPQRFCYAGSVFRYIEPQAGRQREFRQAGIELIGAKKPAADAEVLALTACALDAVGLADFRLVVGQMLYFTGLLQDLALAPPAKTLLQQAVNANSEAALADFLREVPLRTQQRRTVEELPGLSGPHAAAIIAQADRHSLNYSMHAAVANLRAICDLLDAYGVADKLYVDLTEINNLGYYTGITFEVLAPGLGFSLASGGRYDNLVGTFGPPQPAVGVALGIDRMLLAACANQEEAAEIGPQPPHALVQAGRSPEALAWVQRWRKRGIRIAVDVDDLDPHALQATAREIGVPRVLVWTDPGFRLFTPAAEPAPAQVLSLAEADAAMEEFV